MEAWSFNHAALCAGFTLPEGELLKNPLNMAERRGQSSQRIISRLRDSRILSILTRFFLDKWIKVSEIVSGGPQAPP